MSRPLKVPKQIHIAPMGYEKERIVHPLTDNDADYAILLDYYPRDGDEAKINHPPYHEDVRQEIRSVGVEILDIDCDIFDLYSSLGTIAKLAAEFEYHNVYVNLSSGSKVTAIGGMIACMATGAIPYYVKAEEYAGGDESPVACDVSGVESLPKYPITPPHRQHIAILDHVAANESVTKQDLIRLGKEENLPFYARYDTDNVNDPMRGYYRRLDSQIIDPLLEQGHIEVEEHSKYRYVSVTRSGENTLEAFEYLWSGATDVLPDDFSF